MVSKKISDSCYPITVKIGKEMRNGTLVLNVIHGKELEIEYAKKEIIDKINSFFGYDCISQITLKIVQERIKPKQNQFPKIIREIRGVGFIIGIQIIKDQNKFIQKY